MSTSNLTAERTVFRVPASRLAWGEYHGERKTGEGDIHASYSADRISENKSIRKPFEWQASLWCCVSIVPRGLTVTNQEEVTAYRVVPQRMFTGDTTTYGGRAAREDDLEAARGDPLGFYNGVIVRHGKNSFVLCGPPATFIAGEEQAGAKLIDSGVQLKLF